MVNSTAVGRNSATPPTTIIRPRANGLLPDWRELWSYRELIYFMTWRDVKIRYKQTIIGFAWVLLQPALMTGIFTCLRIAAAALAPTPCTGLPHFIRNQIK